MLRRTGRVITFVSGFLFAASLALWARSHLLVDFVHHEHLVRTGETLVWDHRSVTNWRGRVSLTVKHVVAKLPHPDWREQDIANARNGWRHHRTDGNRIISNYHGIKRPTILGFGWQRINSRSSMDSVEGWVVVLPWWAPVLVFGARPCLGLIQFLKTRWSAGTRAPGFNP